MRPLPMFYSPARTLTYLIAIASLMISISQGRADTDTPEVGNTDGAYIRSSIANARFGDPSLKSQLMKAQDLSAAIGRKVFGQERIAEIFQRKLEQYMRERGTRTKDPIALH